MRRRKPRSGVLRREVMGRWGLGPDAERSEGFGGGRASAPRAVGSRLWPCTALALLATGALGDTQSESPEAAVARYDYLLHCAGCHIADGRGAPPEVPPLRSMARLAAMPNGRDYLARVPEVAQAPLPNARLANLLNWAVQEFSRDTSAAGFRPLSAKEVGDARARILKDPLRARAEILKAAR